MRSMTARELQVGKSIEVEMGKKTKKVTDEADQDWRGECFEWWGKWPKLGIACLHGTRDRRTRTSEDTSMLERERERDWGQRKDREQSRQTGRPSLPIASM